jgi:hypothetical protein
MGEESQFHAVTDAEADEAIRFCEKAIPHNELIGRTLRNIYARLQRLEKENASFKDELEQLRAKRKARE